MSHQDAEKIIYEGHPSWRGILSFYAKGAGIIIVVAAIAALITRITGDSIAWGTVILVAIAGIAIVTVVGLIRRVTITYTISDRRLYIKRGILSKQVQQTNLTRVQNVNTSQSPVDRLLRVGRVDFDTAGTDDSDFTFVAVANPDAIVSFVHDAQREAERAGTGPSAATGGV
jgi:uncharacterized membrane protein YdbT with pleckstrin-like domain